MNLTYNTFWQRLLAGIIDSVPLIAMGVIANLITPSNGEMYTLTSTIVDSSIWLIYSIYLHGRYGQTLGKMAMRIKVVTTTGKQITYFQAFKRDSIYVLLAIITIVTFFTHATEYQNYNESLSYLQNFDLTSVDVDDPKFTKYMEAASSISSSPVTWLGYISIFYFLIELITMLTNKKRRALHDFIASTEVRRINEKM